MWPFQKLDKEQECSLSTLTYKCLCLKDTCSLFSLSLVTCLCVEPRTDHTESWGKYISSEPEEEEEGVGKAGGGDPKGTSDTGRLSLQAILILYIQNVYMQCLGRLCSETVYKITSI